MRYVTAASLEFPSLGADRSLPSGEAIGRACCRHCSPAQASERVRSRLRGPNGHRVGAPHQPHRSRRKTCKCSFALAASAPRKQTEVTPLSPPRSSTVARRCSAEATAAGCQRRCLPRETRVRATTLVTSSVVARAVRNGDGARFWNAAMSLEFRMIGISSVLVRLHT